MRDKIEAQLANVTKAEAETAQLAQRAQQALNDASVRLIELRAQQRLLTDLLKDGA